MKKSISFKPKFWDETKVPDKLVDDSKDCFIGLSSKNKESFLNNFREFTNSFNNRRFINVSTSIVVSPVFPNLSAIMTNEFDKMRTRVTFTCDGDPISPYELDFYERPSQFFVNSGDNKPEEGVVTAEPEKPNKNTKFVGIDLDLSKLSGFGTIEAKNEWKKIEITEEPIERIEGIIDNPALREYQTNSIQKHRHFFEYEYSGEAAQSLDEIPLDKPEI